jgi:hypothetical protein
MIAITQQDVEEALDQVDHRGLERNRRSKGYCLVVRNRHYPPKDVLRRIYLKKSEPVADLRGGKTTNDRFTALGYVVEKHDCRNPGFKIID